MHIPQFKGWGNGHTVRGKKKGATVKIKSTENSNDQ